MKTFFRLILFFILPVVLHSCNDDDDKDNSPAFVKEVKVITTVKADEIRERYRELLPFIGITGAELDNLVAKLKYDVVVSVINYEVKDPSGNLRTLSGLVCYPVLPEADKNKKLRIYAYLHGTIDSNEEAPSNIGADDVRRDFNFFHAAHENGYIGVAPDYFGYGADKDEMHYYEHRETLASASRGMIDIIPDYVKQKSLQVNFDKLFIAGYSEGGFAALSTLKSYSEKSSRFADFVTIGGAGAYDTKETLVHVLNQTTGNPLFASTYAWVIMTYNTVYNNRDYDKIFKAPYADLLKKHEGKNTIIEAVEELPSLATDLFHSDFINGILDGTDKAFIDALNDNDASNFNAKGKVYLIHGDQDPWVPPFNTDVAYERLKAKGVNVEKEVIKGGTHEDLTDIAFNLRFIEEMNK